MKAVSQERKYLIGDVARIAGLSRDALRFYEKKGIISSSKMDNGYRCYSDLDIYRLMHILYYRKMNISLGDLEELMSGRAEPVASTRESIARQIEEEKAELKRHQWAITRLQMVQRDMERIERFTNRCTIKSFPSAYILESCGSFQEGLEKWFDLSSAVEALDMTYFYTVLQFCGGKAVNRGTELLLYSELADKLGEDFPFESCPRTRQQKCIYQVVKSEHMIPEKEQLEKMLQWGRERGLKPGETVYVNVMTCFFKGRKIIYGLELYMPLKGE